MNQGLAELLLGLTGTVVVVLALVGLAFWALTRER